MLKYKYSQSHIAKVLGIAQSTVSKWLNMKSKPVGLQVTALKTTFPDLWDLLTSKWDELNDPIIESRYFDKLTQERLHALFYWENDKLMWKSSKEEAGRESVSGYKLVIVDSNTYNLHRVIWMYHYGYFPEHCIDHIDRNKLNNSLSNLREVSYSCNIINSVKKLPSSGVTGVRWSGIAWVATLHHNNELCYLGSFENLTDAVKARFSKELEIEREKCTDISTAKDYLLKHCPEFVS